MFKIIIEDNKTINESEYWEKLSKFGDKLPKLKKRCGDCAITTGFYTEHAESLKQESKDIQQKVFERWFCHNACVFQNF